MSKMNSTQEEVAFHEAAHAVIAARHGCKVNRWGILTDPEVLGRAPPTCCTTSPLASTRIWSTPLDDRWRRRILAEAEILLAGNLAGWNRDWKRGKYFCMAEESVLDSLVKLHVAPTYIEVETYHGVGSMKISRTVH